MKVWKGHGGARLTIDGNGNRLCQEEAIGADEGRNLCERVELEVLGVGNGSSGLDELNVELVLLCDR